MADKETRQKKQGDDGEPEAILRRVERESETAGRSSVARTADQARDHMMGADKDQDDPIEVWGARIGRGLSVIAFMVLAIWLFNYLGRPR